MAQAKKSDLLVGATKNGDIKISVAKSLNEEKVKKLMKSDGLKISK